MLAMQICGESNITVIDEAAAAGIPRAVFVSVHDYNVPGLLRSEPGCMLDVCSRPGTAAILLLRS